MKQSKSAQSKKARRRRRALRFRRDHAARHAVLALARTLRVAPTRVFDDCPPAALPPCRRAQAKADAEAKFLGGQGIARQRAAIMEGLRESVNAFKSEVVGLDSKSVMDLMVVTQVRRSYDDLTQRGTRSVEWRGDDATTPVPHRCCARAPSVPTQRIRSTMRPTRIFAVRRPVCYTAGAV